MRVVLAPRGVREHRLVTVNVSVYACLARERYPQLVGARVVAGAAWFEGRVDALDILQSAAE
jgi:hypothetical protein